MLKPKKKKKKFSYIIVFTMKLFKIPVSSRTSIGSNNCGYYINLVITGSTSFLKIYNESRILRMALKINSDNQRIRLNDYEIIISIAVLTSSETTVIIWVGYT